MIGVLHGKGGGHNSSATSYTLLDRYAKPGSGVLSCISVGFLASHLWMMCGSVDLHK